MSETALIWILVVSGILSVFMLFALVLSTASQSRQKKRINFDVADIYTSFTHTKKETRTSLRKGRKTRVNPALGKPYGSHPAKKKQNTKSPWRGSSAVYDYSSYDYSSTSSNDNSGCDSGGGDSGGCD